MSMTLQDARNYVRSFLDTDSEELPDSLVDVWITEGAEKIQRQPWLLSWFTKTWTFQTTADQGEYPLSTIGSDVDEILSIEGERWALKHRPHELMVRKYAWTNLSSEPIEYSIQGTSVFLWNVPNDGYTLIARGYRQPVTATAAANVIDLPEEFHAQVAEWALARAYEQQDDDIMSNQKFQAVLNNVDQYSRKYRRGPTGGDFQIGTWNLRDQFTRGRLPYDWE